MNGREIDRAARRRAYAAAAMRYDGLTFREIGKRMGGVTLETARQAAYRGQRQMDREYEALNSCAELVVRFGSPSRCMHGVWAADHCYQCSASSDETLDRTGEHQ